MVKIIRIAKPLSRIDRYCPECGYPLTWCIHSKVYTHNDINPSWPATVHDKCGVILDSTLPPKDENKYSPYAELLHRVLRIAKKQGYDKKRQDMLVLEVYSLKVLNLPDRTIIAIAFRRADHQTNHENLMKPRGDQNAEK